MSTSVFRPQDSHHGLVDKEIVNTMNKVFLSSERTLVTAIILTRFSSRLVLHAKGSRETSLSLPSVREERIGSDAVFTQRSHPTSERTSRRALGEGGELAALALFSSPECKLQRRPIDVTRIRYVHYTSDGPC